MRAHLIQATTKERDDARLDFPANDAQFAEMREACTACNIRRAQPQTVPEPVQVVTRDSASDNDDYWLGGYAGI